MAGRHVKCYSLFRKQFGSFSKKLNIDLPYDPAVLLLGAYPTQMKTYVHTKASV